MYTDTLTLWQSIMLKNYMAKVKEGRLFAVTHLLQTWTSLSSANSRSVSSLWCMVDHLNSGMRNMVVRGPGLN